MKPTPHDHHHSNHALPFGAELIADNRARFRIWAPDLAALTLEIEGREPLPMQRESDGFFSLVCDADAGACYRYRIDNDHRAIPDPASRLQSNDVHGWSVLVDPQEYNWRQPQWRGRPWREIVIYELHVGCYGGFAGVEKQLRLLAEMGITAIELMPIADFSGARNWGYDGVLPFAPATAYGSPTQLKQLIDCAHEYGLCVYLDVVYNHFGPDGNYLHQYASTFFAKDKTSPWGEEIDFSQPAVRDFFTNNALYWLHEYRFDGLRFDAVHAISDPGWLDEMAERVRNSFGPDRHIHLMLENERNCAAHLARDGEDPRNDAPRLFDAPCLFDAQWNDDWHNVMHVLLTREQEGYYAAYADYPAQKLARSLAEGFVYQGEPSPIHDNRPRGEPSGFLPPTAFINFLQNHDQIGNRAFGERLNTLADPRDLRAAITLQLLMPTIPLLFMGEPWQAKTPFLFFTDFHDDLAAAVRDGRRKEFAAFASFQNEQQRAKIPDPNALSTFEASIARYDEEEEDERSEQQSALALYRELLQLRHSHIVPRLDECKSLGAKAISDTAVIAGWHFGDGAELHIAINFGDHELSITPMRAPVLFNSLTRFSNNTINGSSESNHFHKSDELIRNGKLAAHCAIVTWRDESVAPRTVGI